MKFIKKISECTMTDTIINIFVVFITFLIAEAEYPKPTC